MRTFLPPPAQELFPPLHPDKAHLQAFQANLFSQEFLGRLQAQLLNHQRRLSVEKTHDEFDFRRGKIEGLNEALQLLETLRIEVENPPETTEE